MSAIALLLENILWSVGGAVAGVLLVLAFYCIRNRIYRGVPVIPRKPPDRGRVAYVRSGR